ncbi:hypothetical protein TWF481_004830 [Arthrobotrys musiformis]|uniref:Uncharacterized protein n=1 Tax=Arthrobotrys musiformis TaxID=47236 RepID=A0AAV9WKP4_9PEZI
MMDLDQPSEEGGGGGGGTDQEKSCPPQIQRHMTTLDVETGRRFRGEEVHDIHREQLGFGGDGLLQSICGPDHVTTLESKTSKSFE